MKRDRAIQVLTALYPRSIPSADYDLVLQLVGKVTRSRVLGHSSPTVTDTRTPNPRRAKAKPVNYSNRPALRAAPRLLKRAKATFAAGPTTIGQLAKAIKVHPSYARRVALAVGARVSNARGVGRGGARLWEVVGGGK